MSIKELQLRIKNERENFRAEVMQYLIDTGRETKGRTYFGALAANNPLLVQRLEDGKEIELETIQIVRDYMAANPVGRGAKSNE